MRVAIGTLPLLFAVACGGTTGPEPTQTVKSKLLSSTRCAALDGSAPSLGTWEDVTPLQVNLDAPGFGVKAFAIDPNDSATVYLGTHAQGIYKSSDCGSSWVHINTGVYGHKLDEGRNWAMVLDPRDSSIYTVAGYGPAGVWKSTNGGVDWAQILTPNVIAVAPFKGFIETISMDPTDPAHLIVSFHGPCAAPAPARCIAETKDSGATWNLTAHPPYHSDRDGVYILGGDTWLYGSLNGGARGGIWRTTDAGSTWLQVSTSGASATFYHSPVTGHLFVGGAGGIQESADDGVTWKKTPNTRSFSIVGNGTTLLASNGPCLDTLLPPYEPYWVASETDPQWSVLPSPQMTGGALYLSYDADQGILYSSNCKAGFWRAFIGP